MPDKFKNKYRISSSRLKNWDYSRAGIYFITICTQNREHYFGEITNGKMQLSPVGVMADILWYENKNHANNIELGEYIIMPNHVHGIIILNDLANKINDADETNVETLHATSLQQQSKPPKNEFMASISPKPNSVSTIIRSYKSAITKHARRLDYNFAWQSRFYDHIIRNNESFLRISEYIKNNPANWGNDKFFK